MSAIFSTKGPSYSRQFVKNPATCTRVRWRNSRTVITAMVPAGRVLEPVHRCWPRPAAGETIRDVPTELLSTARPSRTRFFGFLAIIVGAALIGIGATRQWAAIGFVGDTEHAADVPVNGTDLWEGKAVLLAAAVALVLMLVMRIASSATTRRVMAAVVLVLGIAATVIGLWFAFTAESRFAQSEGIDRIAAAVARETGNAEDVVREALEETLRGDLRVELGFSVWLVVIGGVVLGAGGVLSLVWVRERERERAAAAPDEIEEPRPDLAS